MSRQIVLTIGGLLVAAVLLAAGLGGVVARTPALPGMMGGGMPGGPGTMHGGPGMMGPGRGMHPTGDTGRWFIEAMIPHHEDAVVMADLALATATRQEIKDLATAIKATQTAEIEQMRVWYRQWYGAEPQARPMPMHGMPDTASLKDATDVDRAFLEAMIPHHQMAVMMVTMTLPGVEQADLRGLQRAIAADQTAEIAAMSAWYRAWYAATPPAMGPGMMGGRATGGVMAGRAG
jgi:uncharacterized protein (DUF305 family)